MDKMDPLKFAQQLREYHHGALWEEEKHFLWLNSILLAAQAAVFSTALKEKVLIGPELTPQDIVLIALGGLGLFLSIIALRVVRREGIFFTNANTTFTKQHNLVFPDQLPLPSGQPNKCLCELPWLLFSSKLSIRDAFQLVLLAFAVIHAALIIAVCRGWQ